MEDNKLTQKWKDTLLSSLCTGNSAILKYHNFLMSLDRLFTKLEAFDGNVESVAKRRKHKSRSDTARTPQFVQQVQDIIDEDP